MASMEPSANLSTPVINFRVSSQGVHMERVCFLTRDITDTHAFDELLVR